MPQGHDSHQLAKPDTSFISALRQSHPGCTVAVLTDQVTKIELPEDVRLFRHTIDRSKLGRNAYANYYQYLAQVCATALEVQCQHVPNDSAGCPSTLALMQCMHATSAIQQVLARGRTEAACLQAMHATPQGGHCLDNRIDLCRLRLCRSPSCRHWCQRALQTRRTLSSWTWTCLLWTPLRR